MPQGGVQVIVLRVRRRWSFWAGAVLAVLGVVLLITGGPPAIGTVATVLGLTLVIRDGLANRREDQRLMLHRVGTSRLDDPPLGQCAAGFRVAAHGEQRYIESPAVSRLLRDQELPVLDVKRTWTLPDPAAEHKAFILKSRKGRQVVFDSPKLRLRTDLTSKLFAAGGPAEIERTTYFDSEVTNELVGYAVDRHNDGARDTRVYDPIDFVADRHTRRLFDLRDSRCANMIGISTLAVTSSGRLVLLSQSEKNARSQGEIAPSGSGSADVEDLECAQTLQEMARRAMERELRNLLLLERWIKEPGTEALEFLRGH